MARSRTPRGRKAIRAKYRKPKTRRGGSFGWNIAIAVVVIVGVLAVVLTRGGSDSSASDVPPQAANQATDTAGDHWHTYLGVNVCGEWIDAPPEFESAADSGASTGIHTHGDGMIHTHPFFASEEGNNATVGKFMDYGGWSVSADEIDLWSGPASAPEKTDWMNGDTCTFGEYKGKKGEVVWAVDGKVQKGNPSDYRQQNGETIAIGFVPKGTELTLPPEACSTLEGVSSDGGTLTLSKDSPCRADLTTTTSTTAPAATTESTTP